MKSLKAEGIILRRIEYGEADRIITILTNDYGKIRVMAKGVRKAKSKLAGGVELFSVSELHFIKGRSDIGTLVSARMSRHYGEIVKDLDRTELAYAMLKKIDKILEDDTGQEYFEVLDESLGALNDATVPMVLAEISFAMRVLQLLGHVPDFTTDTKGNRLDPESTYEFDFETTAFAPKSDGPFDKNHIKLLKLLAHNSPHVMRTVQGIGRYTEDIAPLIRALVNSVS